jgi:hypothetical protein
LIHRALITPVVFETNNEKSSRCRGHDYSVCELRLSPEEKKMITVRKQTVALYVERSSQQWVVWDPEGNFWIVPSVENPWQHRQVFYPTEETDLEPVPRARGLQRGSRCLQTDCEDHI